MTRAQFIAKLRRIAVEVDDVSRWAVNCGGQLRPSTVGRLAATAAELGELVASSPAGVTSASGFVFVDDNGKFEP